MVSVFISMLQVVYTYIIDQYDPIIVYSNANNIIMRQKLFSMNFPWTYHIWGLLNYESMMYTQRPVVTMSWTHYSNKGNISQASPRKCKTMNNRRTTWSNQGETKMARFGVRAFIEFHHMTYGMGKCLVIGRVEGLADFCQTYPTCRLWWKLSWVTERRIVQSLANRGWHWRHRLIKYNWYIKYINNKSMILCISFEKIAIVKRGSLLITLMIYLTCTWKV